MAQSVANALQFALVQKREWFPSPLSSSPKEDEESSKEVEDNNPSIISPSSLQENLPPPYARENGDFDTIATVSTSRSSPSTLPPSQKKLW